MNGAGTPYTGISPPAVLTGCPLCLRRLTAYQGRFNARTEAGQSYLPDMRVIAPMPATACLCAEGCSPYTSSLKLGSWPAQSRTAFLSGAYRMYPIDLFNSRTVASPHRCTVADTFVPNGGSVEICLKLSHISGDRQKRKAAAPPFSLSFPALWGRVWKGKPCVPFLVCGGPGPITKRVPGFCYFLA